MIHDSVLFNIYKETVFQIQKPFNTKGLGSKHSCGICKSSTPLFFAQNS